MELGKVVLITGCSSGIGLETAIECAKAGHKVFATMRNLSKSSKLEKRIADEKLENIEILELDVSKTEEIENKISSIVRLVDNIDVLFNNAGYLVVGSLEDSTIQEIQEQIDTDLMGPIHLTKLAIPHMKNGEEPGLVINMSSVAGKIGFGFTSSYCTSKFGIEGFSESLRREMNTAKMGGEDRNIRVAVIEAGIVHTDFFKNISRTELSFTSNYAKETDGMDGLIKSIQNKNKWTQPETIAKMIVEEIIPEQGKKFRYVAGPDGKYLVRATHTYNDDQEAIDSEINSIMKQYME